MILDEFLWKLGFVFDNSPLAAVGKALNDVAADAGTTAVALAKSATAAATSSVQTAETAKVATAEIKAEGDAAKETGNEIADAAKKAGDSVAKTAAEGKKGFAALLQGLVGWRAQLAIATGAVGLLALGVTQWIDRALTELDALDAATAESARNTVNEIKTNFAAARALISTTTEDIRKKIALAILPLIAQIVGKFKEWLDANRELIQSGLNRLSEIVGSIASAVGNTVSAINLIIEKTIGWKAAVMLLGAAFLYLNRALIMGAAKSGLALLLNPLTYVAIAIGVVIALVDDLMTHMQGGKSLFGAYWDPIIAGLHKLEAWFGRAKIFIAEHSGLIKGLFALWLGGAVGAFVARLGGIAGAFRGIISGIARTLLTLARPIIYITQLLFGPLVTALKAVAAAIRIVGLAAMANPIVAIIALIVVAVAALAYVIYRNWDAIAAWTTKTWAAIKATVLGVWDGIKTAAGNAADWVMQRWAGVKAFFAGIGDTVAKFFGAGGPINVSAVPAAIQRAQTAPGSAGGNTGRTLQQVSVDASQKATINVYGGDAQENARQVQAELGRQQQTAARNAGAAISY